MDWDHWRRLVGLFKRALRTEQRLTIEELLQLAEAIFDYGLVIQASGEVVRVPALLPDRRDS